MKLRDKLELTAAILVAALWTNVFDRSAYRRIWHAVKLWVGALDKEARVDEATYQNRLDACKACPVYFAKMKTCGSPLKKTDNDLGCFCHIPTKARLKDALCWLEEVGIEAPLAWKSETGKEL